MALRSGFGIWRVIGGSVIHKLLIEDIMINDNK